MADTGGTGGKVRAGNVSVALCSYNGCRHIAAQIDSLLAQSCLPGEILVCDDGSTDGTAQIAEAALVRAADLNISTRVVRNSRNLGYVKNFEQALSLCQGDLIFLCDQDDVWLEHKIASMLPAFASEKVLLVFSDAEVVGPSLAPLGSLFELRRISGDDLSRFAAGGGLPLLFPKGVVTGATAALKADFAKLCAPFPDRGWSHDEWLALWAAAAGGLAPVKEKTILYRQHGLNQIGVPAGPWQQMKHLRQRLRLSLSGRHSIAFGEKSRYLRVALASGLPERLGISQQHVGLLSDYAQWMERRSRACRERSLRGMLKESRNPFCPSFSAWFFAFLLDMIEAATPRSATFGKCNKA